MIAPEADNMEDQRGILTCRRAWHADYACPTSACAAPLFTSFKLRVPDPFVDPRGQLHSVARPLIQRLRPLAF